MSSKNNHYSIYSLQKFSEKNSIQFFILITKKLYSFDKLKKKCKIIPQL